MIVGFCNRKYKPSKKFYNQVADLKKLTRSFPTATRFRHVYRDNNRLADWLANIAKQLQSDSDLTTHLATFHPDTTFFSPPPWPAGAAKE